MKDVTTLLFDVFGTVVDWRSGVARGAEGFLLRHELAHVDAYRLADIWAERYTAPAGEIRSGARPFTTLEALNRENLNATLADLGIDADKLPATELDELNKAWYRVDPWPDSVQGLMRLKQSYIVAPFSTGNTRLLVDMARHAGLPWDTVLGSDALGTYKPSPQAYFRAMELMGTSPDQTCLVAAHNDDLAAARGCGMRTAFVARPTELGPEQKTDLVPLEDWDIVAKDLLDLAVKLNA